VLNKIILQQCKRFRVQAKHIVQLCYILLNTNWHSVVKNEKTLQIR